MKVTYRGALSEGVVVYDHDNRTHVHLAHGKTVEVDDGFARRLLDDHPGDFKADGYDPHPAESASKGEWAEFRAAQGHDVEGLTTKQLIALPDAPVVNEEN